MTDGHSGHAVLLRAAKQLIDARCGDDGPTLRLAEEKRNRIEIICVAAEVDVTADLLHRTLRQGDGQAAIGDVVRTVK